jgi:hypothetical protein
VAAASVLRKSLKGESLEGQGLRGIVERVRQYMPPVYSGSDVVARIENVASNADMAVESLIDTLDKITDEMWAEIERDTEKLSPALREHFGIVAPDMDEEL